MIKAKTWNKKLDPKMGIEEREADIERIQAIQLDAMKEGARRVAKLVEGYQRQDDWTVADDIEEAAKKDFSNWTIKDL